MLVEAAQAEHVTLCTRARQDAGVIQPWEVKVVAIEGETATVRYLHARSPDGRHYEDTDEPLSSLLSTS